MTIHTSIHQFKKFVSFVMRLQCNGVIWIPLICYTQSTTHLDGTKVGYFSHLSLFSTSNILMVNETPRIFPLPAPTSDGINKTKVKFIVKMFFPSRQGRR